MAKYNFVNINFTDLVRMHFSEELATSFDLVEWMESVLDDGIKVSFRYNADYKGYSATATDTNSPDGELYGISAWGSSIQDAISELRVKVDVVCERRDFKAGSDVVKSLERQLIAEVRQLWETRSLK